jgi:hypothetical protein
VGTAALASIFVGEMLVGRFVLDGADTAEATDLLESMFFRERYSLSLDRQRLRFSLARLSSQLR